MLIAIMFRFAGILSGLSFLTSLFSKLGSYGYEQMFFYLGLVFCFLIALPLWFVSKRLEQKRIGEIIKSHKGNHDGVLISTGRTTDAMKSLRSKKSGLRWGGGNIKGANASRGNKRGFMDK